MYGQALPLAVYLREEPDALMSARFEFAPTFGNDIAYPLRVTSVREGDDHPITPPEHHHRCQGKGKQKAHTPPATPIVSILSFLFIGADPYTLGFYGPRPQSSNLKDPMRVCQLMLLVVW